MARNTRPAQSKRTERRISRPLDPFISVPLPGCEDFIERIVCLIEARQIPKSRDSEIVCLNLQRPPAWLYSAATVIDSKLGLRTKYNTMQAVWHTCLVDGLPPFLQDEDAIQAEINCSMFNDKSTSLDGCRLSDVLRTALGEVVPKIDSGIQRVNVYVTQQTASQLEVVHNRIGCRQHTAASLAIMRCLATQSTGAKGVINKEHRQYCRDHVRKYQEAMHDRRYMAQSLTDLLERSAGLCIPDFQDDARSA